MSTAGMLQVNKNINRGGVKYLKTCVKHPLSKIQKKMVFKTNYRLMQVKSISECSPFNAGQKYCSVLQGEHSAIILTFIKIPFVKPLYLSIFEWPFYTGFIVHKIFSMMRVNTYS